MKRTSTFAVVDLETTGADLEKDKIIQFACVFIENGKVVHSFSTDINPGKKISKHIENLTGISNKQVSKAPYFEEVGFIIQQMLEECVFVAHNVYFDYSFLNSEFERMGLPNLKLKSLDTVELAQMMYPKSPGFRVGDLADYLHLDHSNPHQAYSDALVTSQLFVAIVDKLSSLPIVTLEQLGELSSELGVNNQELIQMILFDEEERRKDDRLDPMYKKINTIIIRKKERDYLPVDSDILSTPYLDIDKSVLFERGLLHRKEQVEMMDEIYKFHQQKNIKNFFIQGDTGIGKTLGYLLPMSFISDENHPTVISTSTMVLQEQLINKEINKLSQILGHPVRSVLLKSNRHYLHLEAFYKSLQSPVKQKQYAIYQMAVLIWLLETNTGDLDELTLNKQHLFYDHVSHIGIKYLNPSSPFYEEDFLVYQEERKKYATFIITNHAYLIEENKRKESSLPKHYSLVVDEAHKLIETIEQKQSKHISFNQSVYLLKQLNDLSQLHDTLISQHLHPQLVKISELLLALFEEIEHNLKEMEQFMIVSYRLKQQEKEVAISEHDFMYKWPNPIKKLLKHLRLLFRETTILCTELDQYLMSHLDDFLSKEILKLKEFIFSIRKLNDWGVEFNDYFATFDEEREVRWMDYQKQRLTLYASTFVPIRGTEDVWYTQSNKVIYTTGTLQTNNPLYLEDELGIPKETSQHWKMPSVYDYKEQTRFYTPFSDESIADLPTSKQSRYIANVVKKIHGQEKKAMLVLFTSHDLLAITYEKLTEYCSENGVDLLAQNISGSRDKIMRRFNKSEQGIILGATSFWEGVDFPGDTLEIVIMTKLPFDPPHRPIIKAKYDYIESQGKNPFYTEAIPKAGMRLRQGLGRLLRSETDRGVVVMLDDRFITASYGREIQSYLPEELEYKQLTMNDMLEDINYFFHEK